MRPCAQYEGTKRMNRVDGFWVNEFYPLFVMPVDEWSSVMQWQKWGVPLPKMQAFVNRRKKKRADQRMQELERYTEAYGK